MYSLIRVKENSIKRLRYRLEYGVLIGFAVVFRLFPEHAAYALARFLGWFAFHVLGIRRKTALENVRAAFGGTLTEREIRRIARDSYIHIAMTFVEMLLLPRIAGRFFEVVDTSALSPLHRIDEQGKGAILVSCHYSNWELAGSAVGMEGFPVTVVAKRQSNPYVDARIVSYRENMHMRIITPGAPAKHLVRALRNNEMVGLISDQDARSRGVFVNFFGHPASTPRGAAELALKYGSPVAVCMIVRLRPGKYRSIFREVEVRHDDTIESLTQRYTSAMEDIIREHPEQYFWMHRRWKTRPPAAHDTGLSGGSAPGSTEAV